MKIAVLQSWRERRPGRGQVERLAGILASALAAFMLLSSAALKIMAAPDTVAEFSRLGYGADRLATLAALEIVCVAVYLVPHTQFLGAVLMTAYLGGAVATHVRIGDPFWLPVTVAFLAWAGLSLRDERVRALWLPTPKEPSRAADRSMQPAAA